MNQCSPWVTNRLYSLAQYRRNGRVVKGKQAVEKTLFSSIDLCAQSADIHTGVSKHIASEHFCAPALRAAAHAVFEWSVPTLDVPSILKMWKYLSETQSSLDFGCDA